MNIADRIWDLQNELETAEMSFLQQKGWKHTSSTPDFVWRWVKTLDDGTRIMLDRADALALEGLHDSARRIHRERHQPQTVQLVGPTRHQMSGVKLTYAIEMLRGLIATMEQHAPMTIELDQTQHVHEVPHPTRVHRELAGVARFTVSVHFAPGAVKGIEPLVADQQPE